MSLVKTAYHCCIVCGLLSADTLWTPGDVVWGQRVSKEAESCDDPLCCWLFSVLEMRRRVLQRLESVTEDDLTDDEASKLERQ